ncbi:MAG: sulfatase family protein [Thalassotalea sp.]
MGFKNKIIFLMCCSLANGVFADDSTVSEVNGVSTVKKPNFVWLLSEDNSSDYLRLYNQRGAIMPNVEALAQQGLIFNNAFSNAPVCSTARTTLATGAYAAKIATQHHRTYQQAVLPDGLKPIGSLLQDAGYFTSNDVKTDFNFVEKQPTWSLSKHNASWRDRKAGQPFFHMQTWGTTHEGSLHFPSTDVVNQPTTHQVNKVDLAPIYPDTDLFRYTHARYLDNHVKVDSQIGTVIDKLKADGLLEDTFVFYFGDHGGVLPGTKGYINERGLHVPLIVRIPENFKHLLNKDMQNLTNTRVDGFVSFIDFAPTLLALAGVDKNEHHDGNAFLGEKVSLASLNQRKTTFAFADRFDEKYDLVRSVRLDQYKYVRHFQPFNTDSLYNAYRYKQAAFQQWKDYFLAGKLNAMQASFFQKKPVEALYDINNDPYETNNLAGDKQHNSRLRALRNRLTQKLKSLPDLGFYPEYWQNIVTSNLQLNKASQAAEHKLVIAELIDIANLSLGQYSEVKAKISQALTSTNPWHRYWALITLLSFDKTAIDFSEQVKEVAKNDTTLLNRARALQFLSLVNNENPVAALQELVANSTNAMEALLMLNIATQLKEAKGYQFIIAMKAAWQKPQTKVKPIPRQAYEQIMLNYWMDNRIKYLKR